MPAGMMFFLGCHLVDLVMRIQGEPQSIIPLNRRTGVDGIDAPDFGIAALCYPHGVSFVKTTDVERGGYLRRQLVVTGTKGTVEIKPLERGPESGMITEQTLYTSNEWNEPGRHTQFAPHDRYADMLAAFAAMVRGECANPFTLDYELSLYKNVLRCCGVNV